MNTVTGWRTALSLAGMALLLLAGCQKFFKPDANNSPPSTQQVSGQPSPFQPPPPPPGGGGNGGGGNPIVPGAGPGVMAGRGAGMKTDARNQIGQIAKFYIAFNTEFNRSPASKKELMDYLKTEANKEYQSLQEGYFEIVPNAQLASNIILVYEAKADNAGKHFVAMGDGSVSAGTTQEVKAALGLR